MKNSTVDPKRFQSIVRMMLYLVKHSRLNIANMTQELLKVNDGANPAAFCELFCVIRYVLDINLGLNLEPSGNASKP